MCCKFDSFYTHNCHNCSCNGCRLSRVGIQFEIKHNPSMICCHIHIICCFIYATRKPTCFGTQFFLERMRVRQKEVGWSYHESYHCSWLQVFWWHCNTNDIPRGFGIFYVHNCSTRFVPHEWFSQWWTITNPTPHHIVTVTVLNSIQTLSHFCNFLLVQFHGQWNGTAEKKINHGPGFVIEHVECRMPKSK